ncbi:MAG TPA: A/G-specific adenine glycosylase [Chitinophagales bacterium]|jgi:A/G-specific adenine glycosylase|nr:A/G-specific adenine glycosylase [Chitinophagales bacterium]MBP6153594.1 A/G-specific adenine glycosylase [Chitinophagales bacterium]HQV77906.1 A/G-specific adenine glycosylase [Chitinophagales bacterium]HQW78628.1 A/G-specific adenine glycosylase [Chitinophagales bacterium]HRB92981.1 A/G-specific adenine glycosylase [Chitinophagales bacterium]
MNSFSKILLEWHKPIQRKLPWKQSNDAYKIWLSEIILQQTRVEQGIPYYEAFVLAFPTIQHLANASLDDVLKRWEGLGYYSRARNLHHAAQQIVQEYNGIFPNEYAAILKLKGVGKYTAAAIASFAFNLPHAVVDGNVFRFLSRLHGIHTPIDTSIGKNIFDELAHQFLDGKNAGKHNQAIMDFGALICKPQRPNCSVCPFSSNCKALQENTIQLLPIKRNKLLKKNRFFNYYVIYSKQYIYIHQRTKKDIWKGLYEFPMEESATFEIDYFRINSSFLTHQFNLQKSNSHTYAKTYQQTLSHQKIHATFYEIRLNSIASLNKSYLKININELKRYAFPKIIRSYLEDRLNYLS